LFTLRNYTKTANAIKRGLKKAGLIVPLGMYMGNERDDRVYGVTPQRYAYHHYVIEVEGTYPNVLA